MKKGMITGRQGFSLLEVTIVLGIVGLIVTGTWLIMGQINENSRNSRLLAQITEIIGNTRQVLSKSSEVPVLSVSRGIISGIFPADMVRSPTMVVHAQRGNAQLAYDASGAGAPIVNLTLTGIRRETCVYLVTKIVGSAAVRRQYGIMGLIMGGVGGSNVLTDQDVPVANLIEACNVTNSPTVGFSMTFQFTIM